MIGFTVRWEPYGDGLVPEPVAEWAVIDNGVFEAQMEYARELAAQHYWDVTAWEMVWGIQAVAAELAEQLNVHATYRVEDHAAV